MRQHQRFAWLMRSPVAAPAVAVAALMLAAGACSPQPDVPDEAVSPAAARPASEAVPAAVTGEVPAELLESILDDLMAQEGLQREAIEVERSEYVIWPDGSLGCPEPGVMYTQAQVPGYWVVLRAGDRQYDYRASEKGQFRRCKGSFKVQLPIG